MPLDMERLRAGDHAEWEEAFRELQLLRVSHALARRILDAPGKRHLLAHVEDLASTALTKLANRAIHRCPSESAIVPYLCRIIGDEAVNLLRRPWARQHQRETDQAMAPAQDAGMGQVIPNPADGGVDNRERLWEQVAEQFGLAAPDLEAVVHRLVEALRLSQFDEALLREHVVGGITQAQFAERHGCPMGRVGRRTSELLLKIRRWFGRGRCF